MTNSNLKLAVIALSAIILFVFDRLTKWYAINLLAATQICSKWLRLTLNKNSGIAFGISFNYWLLITLVVVSMVVLIYLIYQEKKQEKFFNFFLLLIVAVGALSNLVDRLLYGYVIDFIDVSWFSIFNLADCYIVSGVLFFSLNKVTKN